MAEKFTSEELQEIKELLSKEKFKHLYKNQYRKETELVISYEGYNLVIFYDLLVGTDVISLAFRFYRLLDHAPDSVYKKVRIDFERLLFRGFKYSHTHENIITVDMESVEELRGVLDILRTNVSKVVRSLDGMYNRRRGRV